MAHGLDGVFVLLACLDGARPDEEVGFGSREGDVEHVEIVDAFLEFFLLFLYAIDGMVNIGVIGGDGCDRKRIEGGTIGSGAPQDVVAAEFLEFPIAEGDEDGVAREAF